MRFFVVEDAEEVAVLPVPFTPAPFSSAMMTWLASFRMMSPVIRSLSL